jgi:hypothetical protein
VLDRRAARLEKVLNFVQVLRRRVLAHAQPKCLGDGRIGPVKNHIRAGDANGLGAALRVESQPGESELPAGVAFGGLQAAGKGEIGKNHNEG